jgi:hypothetical protein
MAAEDMALLDGLGQDEQTSLGSRCCWDPRTVT